MSRHRKRNRHRHPEPTTEKDRILSEVGRMHALGHLRFVSDDEQAEKADKAKERE